MTIKWTKTEKQMRQHLVDQQELIQELWDTLEEYGRDERWKLKPLPKEVVKKSKG